MNDKPIKRATKYEKERLWFGKHRRELEKKYPGKWIAISGEELIAVGEGRSEVAEIARAKGVTDPIITALRRKEFQGVYLIR